MSGLVVAFGCVTPSFAGTYAIKTTTEKTDVVCNSTGKRWTLTCVDSSWRGTVGDCSQDVNNFLG